MQNMWFKIKMRGMIGEYYFVVNTSDAQHAIGMCQNILPPIERRISEPIKTTKKFIKGIKPNGIVIKHYIVAV